jgi:hypothetical protein
MAAGDHPLNDPDNMFAIDDMYVRRTVGLPVFRCAAVKKVSLPAVRNLACGRVLR